MEHTRTNAECQMKRIQYNPIGTIHSPFKDVKGMPIQPRYWKGIKGIVELKPKYVDGLESIEGFSHIILLYHFHLSLKGSLRLIPFLDVRSHGVFATRAPQRPNPLGMSVVRLVRVKANILYIENVDVVDGTPLLDIKPFVPLFDVYKTDRIGWLSKFARKARHAKSDGRFS
jgi:tRNA-Thr(GGU) m(6)t(6)A37 methyltransferase TsaA